MQHVDARYQMYQYVSILSIHENKDVSVLEKMQIVTAGIKPQPSALSKDKLDIMFYNQGTLIRIKLG